MKTLITAVLAATFAVIGTSLRLSPEYTGTIVTEGQVIHEWQNLVDAGGVATQDAASVANPTTQVTNSTSKVVTLERPVGHFVSVSLGYDDGLTAITNPAGRLFGRKGSTGRWTLLPNRAGGTDVTITTATTDVTDGTLLYTTPDPDEHVWERCGCDQFIWGTQTALAGTGTTSNAVLQIKVR